MTAGRPPRFSSNNDLVLAFLEWKETFDKGGEREDEIPDVEGFCDHIDSYRDLFSAYEKKEEFSDTIKRIKNWIYYKKKQLAMKNQMNATIFIFDAKNNAGYVDKTEFEGELNGNLVGVSPDQAEQLIRARTSRSDI